MKKKNFTDMDRTPRMWIGAALCSALLFAAGCSNDNEKDVPDADGRVALQVSSGITVQSRAYDKTWEAGDAIGIYMLNGTTTEAANKQYLTDTESTSGLFAPAAASTIYFPVDGTTRDFIAYYPYRELGDGNTTYTIDVSNQTSQKEIDLMGAAKISGKHKNDPKVAFSFTHKLAKVALTIQPDGTSLTPEQLKGMTVKLTNQRTLAAYDVVTGESVTVDTQRAPATLTLQTDADGTKAEGIVLPCTDTDGMQLEFHLQGGATYSWAVKEAPLSQQFAAGSKYKYTITIANIGLEVTSTVTDWAPGNGAGESGNAQ